MHSSFAHTAHRPWSLPKSAPTWRQTWRDLLFAHWSVPSHLLQPLVPQPLELETEQGHSWVGVVPFRMTGVTLRYLPALPGLSAFPELNLRLYVTHAGKPGVWFLSLDATNPVAVWAAQRFFHLPYYRAQITTSEKDGSFTYRSKRKNPGSAFFSGNYRPISPAYSAKKASLEHHLTERYCMYAQAANGHLYRTEVHHKAWPLQKAAAELDPTGLTRDLGFQLEGPPALLHFSRRIHVVLWRSERLSEREVMK